MFKFAGTVSGGMGPYSRTVTNRYVAGASRTYTIGEIVNLASGRVVLGATGNTSLLGVVAGTVKDAVSGTTQIPVTDIWDAVWEVTDNNARNPGDTANINATGNGIATGTADFEHVWQSTAAQPSYVAIQRAKRAAKLV